MMRSTGVLMIAFAGVHAFAQISPILPSEDSLSNRSRGRVNANVSTAKPDPKVVVFVGDRVIPQFVDGGGWKTSVTMVNLENHPTSFQVLFFRDDGSDLAVPVVGQGVVIGMNVALNTAGSATFETAGIGANVAQGWAMLSQTTNDSVGAFAIFRETGTGQEAVVPVVNQFESHFVMPYDNTASFVTGAAFANPSSQAVVIPLNIRNEAGQIIDQRTISLGAFAHVAFSVPATWGSTQGIRGAIEFTTSGFGIGALGLRFNGAAFTSFSVLENFNWVVP